MPRRQLPKSWTANRRGCFAIAAVLAALVAVLLYIGLRAGPDNDLNSVLPTFGAAIGLAAGRAASLRP